MSIVSNSVVVLNDRELAKRLDPSGKVITPWTLRRWRLAEGMPHMQFGRRILFNLESVEKWMRDRECSGEREEVVPRYGQLRRVE